VVLLRVIPDVVERHDGETGRMQAVFDRPRRGR